MPLIKRKSKKAFEHNIEAEMDAGKPQPQALAIAYDVRRRAKKAKGGSVDAPEGYKGRKHYFDTDEGPEGIIRHKEEHDPELHKMTPEEHEELARKIHESKEQKHHEKPEGLKDEKDAKPPKLQPKLKKLADGGEVKPKIQPKAYPKMIPSSVIKSKHLDAYGRLTEDEKDLESSAKPNNGPQHQPPKSMDEEGVDRQGPESKDLHMKRMAEGGDVHREMMMQPEPEAREERHDSLAAAIMAKRQRLAEGGEAMLKENYTEQPNGYYKENEHEALDWEAADVPMPSQPEDSNDHGDDIDSDKHDHIEQMRRKMKSRKQF